MTEAIVSNISVLHTYTPITINTTSAIHIPSFEEKFGPLIDEYLNKRFEIVDLIKVKKDE